MKAIKVDEGYKVFIEIPEKWNGITDYNKLPEEIHFKNGWRDIVVPVITESQKFGELISVDDNVTYNVIELTDEEKNALEVKKIKDQENSIINKYEFHKQKGWDFYQHFRAKIVLDIYAGEISEMQAFEIEGYLQSAFDKISNTGDWKTAYFILNKKSTEQEFILKYEEMALEAIVLYIQENYEN